MKNSESINQHQQPHPLSRANIFSRIFFCWLNSIISKSRKKPWEQSMHPQLPAYDKVENHKKKFEQIFKKKKGIISTAVKIHFSSFVKFAVVAFFISVIYFSSSYFTKSVIDQLKETVDFHTSEALQSLIINFSAIAFISVFSTIMGSFFYFQAERLTLLIRSTVMSVIQSKILKFSVLNSNRFTEGKITNLLQVDVKRIFFLIPKYVVFCQNIFDLIIGFISMFLLTDLKVAGVVMGTYTGIYLLYIGVYILRGKATNDLLKAKDDRIAYFKNVLMNIEYIKSRALENFYSFKIFQKRRIELQKLKKIVLAAGLGEAIDWGSANFAIYMLIVYFTFFFKGKFENGAFIAFIQVFGNLRNAYYLLFKTMVFMVETKVSVNRLNEFLNARETDQHMVKHIIENENHRDDIVLKVKNGNFCWDEDLRHINCPKNKSSRLVSQMVEGMDETLFDSSYASINAEDIEKNLQGFELRNIQIQISKGEKVIIFGESGSGKSSLLYAMLGEMTSLDGNSQVTHRGKISFLAQERWLVGDTIRENITQGKPFDEEMMNLALEASQLKDEIKNLDYGLDTVLGDTSSTVSGGQKARIALARCFYQDSDIMILDDPTSSLDMKVTAKIMDLICNHPRWKEKTFIITTHNHKLVRLSDRAVFMHQGIIIFNGNQDDLGDLEQLRELYQSNKNEHQPESDETEDFKLDDKSDQQELAKQEEENPIEEEEEPEPVSFYFNEDKQEGALSLGVINHTLKGMGGYLWWICLLIIPIASSYGSRQAVVKTLDWGKTYSKENIKDEEIRATVLNWAIFLTFAGFLRQYSINISCAWLSKKVHSRMIFRLLHSKINEFLKRIPSGMFLNRFSNDIDAIDLRIGPMLLALLFTLLRTIVKVEAIINGTDNAFLLIPLIIFILISFRIRNGFMAAQRDMIRLFASSRSPMIGLSSACILGAPIIRGLGNQEYYSKKVDHYINENSKNMLMKAGLDSWLIINLAITNFLVVLIPCYSLMIYTLYTSDSSAQAQDQTKIAFFLISVANFANDYTFFLRNTTYIETDLICVERCLAFENISTESGYKTQARDQSNFEIIRRDTKEMTPILKRSMNFEPLVKSGQIELKNISYCYPTSSKNVITNLNLIIQPKEKIGIVGRTGAGKSSLIKLLWRAMDPTQGQILVDGHPINNWDLKNYRDQICLISQETALFEGTLSSNISACPPLTNQETRNYEQLLKTLNFPIQKLQAENLSFVLQAGAVNLSEGEKQIVSFVRGLHNLRKIVILDEATAYVDPKTEKEMKKITDEAFKNATLLIIAHRLDTVLDCDKILVLGNGSVLEFDSPQNLLADPNSEFSQIYKHK